MFEQDITTLLGPLVAGEIYWDETPDAYIVPPGGCIVIQQVGGRGYWYVDGDAPMPDHKNARLQIMVWTHRRIDTNPLIRLVEKTIAESGMIAEPYGAFVSMMQDDLGLHGARQDFGFWYPDS